MADTADNSSMASQIAKLSNYISVLDSKIEYVIDLIEKGEKK